MFWELSQVSDLVNQEQAGSGQPQASTTISTEHIAQPRQLSVVAEPKSIGEKLTIGGEYSEQIKATGHVAIASRGIQEALRLVCFDWRPIRVNMTMS